MLKEAIEKIQQLANSAIAIDVNGQTFTREVDGNFIQLREELDYPQNIELSSLDAVVKMVKTEALLRYTDTPIYIEADRHDRVSVFLQPNPALRFERQQIYRAFATDVPGWDATTKMPFEQAAVALQTRFQPSNDREYALQLLSQITTGAKITYNDIGVATTIVTQKGVSLQQNSTIRPIITLKPYRIFQELDQPEGLFLIRIDERGITFTEADGGMWKLEARKRIVAYFTENLKEEIEGGRVVVML